MILIGVDCAVDEKNIGLARGSMVSGKLVIHEIALGSRPGSIAELITSWLPTGSPALLALDAPLGWPAPLAAELSHHTAGLPLQARPTDLFSRLTDQVVRASLGKIPLEVGADRIARTAYAALKLLQQVRERTGLAIPLAWQPADLSQTCAIEVYPAATLAALKLKSPGYKKPEGALARRQLIEAMFDYLEINPEKALLELSPHALDAIICVLAAHDFLQGRCILPDDEARVWKEGWIWVRRPF